MIPAGPPPAITQRVCSFSATDYTDSTDEKHLLLHAVKATERRCTAKRKLHTCARENGHVLEVGSVLPLLYQHRCFHLCYLCNPWLSS